MPSRIQDAGTRATRQAPLIKICGITNEPDALAAIEAGADALGFNFYPRSPRYVDPGLLEDWIHHLPGTVVKVGVFVNEAPSNIARIVDRLALDVIQLHGDEPPEAMPKERRVWKAARVGPGFAFAQYDRFSVEALLLDGPAEQVFGGAGSSFDWRLAAASPRKLIIAGGLDPGNVAQAIACARPWGVDACSRLESAPGKKDHACMIRFVKAVREA